MLLTLAVVVVDGHEDRSQALLVHDKIVGVPLAVGGAASAVSCVAAGLLLADGWVGLRDGCWSRKDRSRETLHVYVSNVFFRLLQCEGRSTWKRKRWKGAFVE